MKQPSSDRLDDLIARLMDEDEDVRYDTAREFASKERPSVELILTWADDSRPRLREMACFFLGAAGYARTPEAPAIHLYPAGVPTLIRLLDDPDEDVRASAAIALGFHTDLSTLPALLRLVSDPSAEVRYALASSLGSFHSWEEEESIPFKAQVAAALLHLMDDKDEEVRDWATFGIHQGNHDTSETRARLWQALEDPNTNVRGEAAEGLAKFGDRSLIPRLEILLGDQEELRPVISSPLKHWATPFCSLPCWTPPDVGVSGVKIMTGSLNQPFRRFRKRRRQNKERAEKS